MPGPGSYQTKDLMAEDPSFQVIRFLRAPRYKNPQSISDQIHQLNLAKKKQIENRYRQGPSEFLGCKLENLIDLF